MRAGAEHHRVVPGHPGGQHIGAVGDEITDHGVAAGGADHVVLATRPVHARHPVAVGGQQGSQAASDAAGGADQEDAVGWFGLSGHGCLVVRSEVDGEKSSAAEGVADVGSAGEGDSADELRWAVGGGGVGVRPVAAQPSGGPGGQVHLFIVGSQDERAGQYVEQLLRAGRVGSGSVDVARNQTPPPQVGDTSTGGGDKEVGRAAGYGGPDQDVAARGARLDGRFLRRGAQENLASAPSCRAMRVMVTRLGFA